MSSAGQMVNGVDSRSIRVEPTASQQFASRASVTTARPSPKIGRLRPPVARPVKSRHTFMMPRTLSPEDVTALRDAVVAVIDSRIEVLDQSLSRGFTALNERLDLVERRIARLEERVAGLVQGHTRSRTTDLDRIAALEARVAEL